VVDSSDSGTVPAEPVVVAVGYGGIRVRSVDRGFTWTDPTELAVGGGDDMNLLRAAAWGNDRFVAAGFRIFSSPDGAQWTEHENPSPQWIGALAFGNGMFLGAGGGGLCARSADGVDWNPCTDVTDDAEFTHVRSVLFFEDRFWAASADGVLRSSPDGDAWAVEDPDFGTPWAGIVANQIAPVEETAPADLLDFRLQGVFAGLIQRAPAKSDAFETVFEVPADNRIFQAYRFSFTVGYPQGS
jgi:hypothetical protein